jgi:hypothetical protein
MQQEFSYLNTDQLRQHLLEAYTGLRSTTDETASIRALKSELYRRGIPQEEVIRIAIAALVRQSLN